MPDNILEKYISSYIDYQPGSEVEFIWHGGELLLAGIEF